MAASPARVLPCQGGDIRPSARGKFVFLRDDKLHVCGVTYGPFRPATGGPQYPGPRTVEQDFSQMAANGVNAVRVYTQPPVWLLDMALRHGLRVMVGLPWEQHVTFLEHKKVAQAVKEHVCAGVRACTGHPGVLCYAIGNEIPAAIVRWHGRRRVERFLKELYEAAKAEEPEALFTYVNYPTTEYLQLPFLDLVCFNVYLEVQADFEAYLARLHHIAGERPLLITELGLDSRRHGQAAQARALNGQVRAAFASGCAGAFVFSWTDEWYRGGCDIEEWDFGLTGRDRSPKRALVAMRKAFAETPFPAHRRWPRVSVVVCTCNGQRTIRECLQGLSKLNYPDFEVIVVDDGSTDETAEIARAYGFRVISTENRGLGVARNLGMQAATGEVVAYLDDDACPDPDWLTYLSSAFWTSDYAGVGGPNLPPPDDGWVAECVAHSPGGPIHVLLSDREAEHIPGCNMAFRKSCLQAIGGFDPQFRAAGDDVDVCWRLQERGWKLGFHPGAVVWHHRRNSVRAYWRQQKGYGKAEALLEKKWPQKYNAAGHVTWTGRIYNNGFAPGFGWGRGRIYQGTWGTAAYQRLYHPRPGALQALPLMPEWHLISLALALLCIAGTFWTPPLLGLPFLTAVVGWALCPVFLTASKARFSVSPAPADLRLKLYLLTAVLHLVQPLARLWGRLSYGLAPWPRGAWGFSLPWTRRFSLWSETWQSPEARLRSVEAALRAGGAVVARGGDYHDWDLEARGGLLGCVRTRMATEEHGAGRQLVRFCSWPRFSPLGLASTGIFAAFSLIAAVSRGLQASVILGSVAMLFALLSLWDCAAATAAVRRVLKDFRFEETR